MTKTKKNKINSRVGTYCPVCKDEELMLLYACRKCGFQTPLCPTCGSNVKRAGNYLVCTNYICRWFKEIGKLRRRPHGVKGASKISKLDLTKNDSECNIEESEERRNEEEKEEELKDDGQIKEAVVNGKPRNNKGDS